jgi:hypothetical protein
MRSSIFSKRAGFLLSVVSAFLVMGVISFVKDASAKAGEGREAEREQVRSQLSVMERGWVRNEGQWDEASAFAAPGYFGTTWVAKGGELLHVLTKGGGCGKAEKGSGLKERPCARQGWVLSEVWVGGEVKTMEGREELSGRVSYFLGNDASRHRSGLATYRCLSLGEVWKGIEVRLKASQTSVEKVFILAPGAELKNINVEVRGAEGLRLTAAGTVVAVTGFGEVELSNPVAWQENGMEKLPVEVRYVLTGENRYGFTVGGYDPTLPLVIDPILQSTYLGGKYNDRATGVTVAPGGVYVAGITYSTDFPGTTGGAQVSKGGGAMDGFVALLTADLKGLIQSTYLGGTQTDEVRSLAVFPGGVYVAGRTYSSDFPGTTGGAQASKAESYDGFAALLTADLKGLIQSTYLGGNDWDESLCLAVSSSGIYVGGYAYSTDFPGATGGAQENNKGGPDAFVTLLTADLKSLVQSTYLGGSNEDGAFALAVSPGGVYLAGRTESSDFTGTTGGAQDTKAPDSTIDAFVAFLQADLRSLTQSTYLGGDGWDEAFSLAVFSSGIYVAGYTSAPDFPGTGGGAQASHGGIYDVFVTLLDENLTSITKSTYLGGTNEDTASAIAVSSSGIYVAGSTASSDFPGTEGGAQASYGGGSHDAFAALLDVNLESLMQSTYLGGTNEDTASAIAVSSSGIFLAGYSSSSDFPNTGGGAQAAKAEGSDAFVVRLTADLGAHQSDATPVPTIDEWGMLLFMIMAFAGSIVYLVRLKRSRA